MQTLEEKTVRDYTGLSFSEIGELGLFDFYLLLRDAVIWRLAQTEAGCDYLRQCWEYEQEKPDRAALESSGLMVMH